MEADVNNVKSSIAELRGQLSGLTTIAIIKGIVVIILAIALIIAMRRRSVSE